MLTNEILARALNQAQGFNRAADLVPLLNDVHNILCKHETDQFRFIMPTGLRSLPSLATTANRLGPYLGPVGTWRVSRIMLAYPLESDYGYTFLDNTLQLPFVNTTERISINGNWYFPYPFIQTQDALEGARPQVWFTRDPGTTAATGATARYYMDAYRIPTQITSDRIQLSIPDSDGAHRMIVFPCLMKLIEAQNNGNYAEAVDYIEMMRDRLWEKLDGAYQGGDHKVQPRPLGTSFGYRLGFGAR